MISEALLYGDDEEIPEELQEEYRKSLIQEPAPEQITQLVLLR